MVNGTTLTIEAGDGAAKCAVVLSVSAKGGIRVRFSWPCSEASANELRTQLATAHATYGSDIDRISRDVGVAPARMEIVGQLRQSA